MSTKQNVRPFGLRDKIGYAMGDFGNNFTFLFASMYLMVFCTDVLGIASGLVGIILMTARFVDAFTDVGMGRICDTFKPTKDGRFRVWIKRMAIPMGLSHMLIYQYWIRDWSSSAKFIWVLVTYIIWGSFFYTSCNIPYGSLSAVITNDAKGRNSLSTFRSVGAMCSGMIIGVVTPMLVYGTNASGQQIVVPEKMTMVAVVFGICSIIFYLGCYALTAERVQIDVVDKKEGGSVTDILKQLITCKPLVVFIVVSLANLIGSLMTSTMNAYLYKDYFNNTTYLSLATLVTTIAMLFVAPVSTKLTTKYGKKEVSAIGMLVAGVVFVVLWIMKLQSPVVFLLLNVISGMGLGFFSLIGWAFIGDIIDYQEIRTNQRTDGTVYSVYSFTRKLGQAASGGLGGYLLVMIGYISSTEGITQTLEVRNGIYTCSTLLPGLCYLLAFVMLAFVYPLTKKRVEENIKMLAEKRAAGNS